MINGQALGQQSTKIYVAGASSEIVRAERQGRLLRDNGFEVVSTWTQVIRDVGHANPTDATPEEYKLWAGRDLAEVQAADVFWLLLPEANTVGAWIELGFAHAINKLIVMSGQHRPIFTPALARFHSHYDQEILSFLIEARALGMIARWANTNPMESR